MSEILYELTEQQHCSVEFSHFQRVVVQTQPQFSHMEKNAVSAQFILYPSKDPTPRIILGASQVVSIHSLLNSLQLQCLLALPVLVGLLEGHRLRPGLQLSNAPSVADSSRPRQT